MIARRAKSLAIGLLALSAAGCVHIGADRGPLEPKGITGAKATPTAETIRAPTWSVGDQWRYSDGYALKVSAIDGALTTFTRVDAPGQWFTRYGFLRDKAQSASTLRETMFRSVAPDQGLALETGKALTFRREYMSNGRLISQSSSWAVEGRERITVPAGTFDCWVLVWRTRDPSTNWSGFERWWYAPAVGHYARLEYRYGNMETTSRVLMDYRFGAPAQGVTNAHAARPPAVQRNGPNGK